MIPVPIIEKVDLDSDGDAFVWFFRWRGYDLTPMAYRMVDGDPTRLEVVE